MQAATRIFTTAMMIATWCLLFVGAMVTSTNSGLSVPDWPTTFGQNMFLYPLSQMKGGILFEHGHRLFASAVGFLALVNAIFLGGRASSRAMRWASYFALFLVIAQGVLGGMTVRMKLPIWVSSSHAGMAQLFFLNTVLLAVMASRTWASQQRAINWGRIMSVPGARALSILLILGYLQICIGAVMRHSYAGLAIPTFPLAFGGILPTFWNFGMVVHFIHTRIMPIALTLVLAYSLKSLWPSPISHVRNAMRTLAALFTAQIFLGAMVIWSFKAPILASLHLALGAAVMGTLFYALLHLLRQGNPLNALHTVGEPQKMRHWESVTA